MSLKIQEQEELFTATNEAESLLNDDDPMVLFSKEVYPLFKDSKFKDMYSTKGRTAISPAFLAMVTLLQFKENLSDEETARACITRLDWKIALHLPIMKKASFESSSLCRFRQRLKEHDQSSIAFDEILELAIEKKFIKKTSNQRIDATHVIKHANKISTTDLLFRTVKCVLEEINVKAPDYYEKNIPEYIRERYLNPFSSFGLSKDKRGERQAEIVEDGLFIKAILQSHPDERLSELKQISIMEIIFEDNIIINRKVVDDKEQIEIEEVKTPIQRVFDPRDPSLHIGIKGKTSWVGAKCQVIETAEKGQTNFVIGMIHQDANENDSKIHERYQEHNKAHELEPEKIFTDGNYISGEAIDDYEKNGQELKGYIQGDNSKKPDAFKLNKFDIDMDSLTAVCPQGHKSVKTTLLKDGNYSISFASTDCKACPYYLECAGDTKDKRRRLRVSKNYDTIRQRRKEQKTESFKEEMKVRAQVEGTISELVRCQGLRKIKYKGLKGRELQFLMSGAALNLKRLLREIKKAA